jgi:hypothetical protein
MVSLRRKYALLFSQTGCTSKTTNSIFSFLNLSYFLNRRAVILLDWRTFLVNLVTLYRESLCFHLFA